MIVQSSRLGNIYIYIYIYIYLIYIIVLEAIALGMIETQVFELHPSFSPRVPPIDQAQSWYLLTGEAEIWSAAHSPTSSTTSVWSQQTSHRSLSLGEDSPGIDILTLSALSNYREGYVQYKYQYIIAILDPYIDTIRGRESS